MDRRATGSNTGLVKSNLPLKCNTGRGRGREGWREMDRKRGEKKREGRSRERKRFKEKKHKGREIWQGYHTRSRPL